MAKGRRSGLSQRLVGRGVPGQFELFLGFAATRLIGLGLDELAALADDDQVFEQRSAQLRALHAIWHSQGVLTMLRQTLHQFDLPARWLRDHGGERRLTNVLHLAELLQEASTHLEGEHALLRWLHTQVHEDRLAGDEQIPLLQAGVLTHVTVDALRSAAGGAFAIENNLAELAADPAAQEAAQTNLGLGAADPLAHYILAKA